MGLFDFFNSVNETSVNKYGLLYEKLKQEFPELEEEKILQTSCIAGLMARVAYVDFDLDDNEVTQMQESLLKFNIADSIDQEIVVKMATSHIKEMAGLENHLYVHSLNKVLNKDQRYRVLQSLFLIAASDGSVDNTESEEIKLICKGLELSTQHFIAARAEVVEFINALR